MIQYLSPFDIDDAILIPIWYWWYNTYPHLILMIQYLSPFDIDDTILIPIWYWWYNTYPHLILMIQYLSPFDINDTILISIWYQYLVLHKVLGLFLTDSNGMVVFSWCKSCWGRKSWDHRQRQRRKCAQFRAGRGQCPLPSVFHTSITREPQCHRQVQQRTGAR